LKGSAPVDFEIFVAAWAAASSAEPSLPRGRPPTLPAAPAACIRPLCIQ
jgi:hypothetical protein